MALLKQILLSITVFSLTLFSFGCMDSTDSTDPSEQDGEERFFSKSAPGSSAELYLRDDKYSALQVEIDYMPGHLPTGDGLDSLKTFLRARLHKQSIEFSVSEIPSGGKDVYSIEDIRSLEDQFRDHFTVKNGDTLHSYFLMVDGEFEQSNVIGVAYWNTSLAIFGKTIEDISAGLAAPPEDKIEGTVFRHEFGHLMGLVGNGTPLQSDHKTAGSAHCTNDGCLMNPAVETANFFANIFEGDIPGLGQFCLHDLQANGGK